jgi:hypothetical protein
MKHILTKPRREARGSRLTAGWVYSELFLNVGRRSQPFRPNS